MRDSIIEQILLHLYDSIDYGSSYSAKRGLWIAEDFNHWKKEINAKKIKDGIYELKRQEFITKKEKYDGSILISLTEKGMLRALKIIFINFNKRKEKWDGKWRMVAFDIPEECRKGRNTLRYRFKVGGFYELQKSLFVYPYDCRKEVVALVKLLKLEKYIRFILVDSIDNENFLKSKFKL